MWFKKYMKMNEAGDNDAGGGGGTGDEQGSDSSENSSTSQEDGDKQFDDFGYEITKTSETASDKSTKTDDESKQDETSEKQEEKSENVIGYEKEPPKQEETKQEEKKEETKEEEKKDEKKDDQASEINFGKLAEGDKKVLGEFFKAQGFSKAQAEALVQLREKEMDEFEKAKSEYQKNIETEKLNIRKQWHDELKNDKVFGKEFEKNLSKVNKVVTEAFPNLKNKLTESKTMLPPYLVRDLLAVHNLLYKTESFTQGDPDKGDESSSEGSDKYDFLNEFYK